MADKRVVWVLVLLLVPVVFAQNIKLLPDQTAELSDSWVKTGDGYVFEEKVVVLSWWEKLVVWLKDLLQLQSVQGLYGSSDTGKTPQEWAGTEWKVNHWAGKVLKETRSPVYLSKDNPKAEFMSAATTDIEYVDKDTGKVMSATVYNSFDFDAVPSSLGGAAETIPDVGNPDTSVRYDSKNGYVTVEGSTVVYHEFNTGYVASDKPDYEDKDFFVTRYDFYVDRAGFGVEFADARNLAVMSNQKLVIPLKLTNNVVEGILCSAEVKIKKTGFYTQDVVMILPWQKCKLGVNDLSLSLDRDELGTYEIEANAILANPSYTQFKKFGNVQSCDENCKYVVGNETIIDDFVVLKKIEIVSQATVNGMNDDSEVYKTYG